MPRTRTSATLSTAFGATLRRRRVELELTQADVAARLEVSSAYVQRIEAGRGNLTLAQAARLAAAVDASLTFSLQPRSPDDKLLLALNEQASQTVPGAWERTERAREQARRGETSSLDDEL